MAGFGAAGLGAGFGIPVGMQLDGFRELKMGLEQLPDKIAKRAVRIALSAAASPIIRDAKAKAPKETGTLQKSIGMTVPKKRFKHTQLVVVGPKSRVRWLRVVQTGKNQGRLRGAGTKTRAKLRAAGRGSEVVKYNPANYAHLVEFGTDPHGPKQARVIFIKRSGRFAAKGVKGTPARPFLRPAFDRNKSKSTKIFGDRLWREIVKEANKIRARTTR